jgi:hypothetical protein
MPLRHNGRASALQRATRSIIASSNVLGSRHNKYLALLHSQVQRTIFARRLARDRAANQRFSYRYGERWLRQVGDSTLQYFNAAGPTASAPAAEGWR